MEGWTALLLFYRLVYTLLPLARNTCAEDDLYVLWLPTSMLHGFGLLLGRITSGFIFTIDDLGSNSHSGPAGLRARLDTSFLLTD